VSPRATSSASQQTRALPRRRGLILVTAAWGAFLLDPISDTGIGFPMALIALIGTGLLALAWLGVLVASGGGGRRPGRWLAWLVLPLVGAAIAVIFITQQSPLNPFFRFRFLLSRPALHAVATDPAAGVVGWIGLFRVQRVDRFASAVHFVTVSCGVVDQCGIAYVLGPPPPPRGKTRLTPLGDGWYHLYSLF
jgi:hypothetical protein